MTAHRSVRRRVAALALAVAATAGGTLLLATPTYADTGPDAAVVAAEPLGNQPPIVAMTGPSNEPYYLSPAILPLTAAASDPDAGDAVTRVEFYDGATLLGTDSTAPYLFVYRGVGRGTHVFTARAYDTRGASSTSAVLLVGVA